ncbi:MAG TPA: hypothetical protein VJX67_24870, partial [Blastocatellia bacterium]|nr:hypothetical protein [Blastocatellia bacterium]
RHVIGNFFRTRLWGAKEALVVPSAEAPREFAIVATWVSSPEFRVSSNCTADLWRAKRRRNHR